MNSRLDTLLRKQLPYQDYLNVRFCEVCVVEENKKIELRYLVLTNSALWSCEYPNPRNLSSLLDLRSLRKIDIIHDFPCFLSGKYRQNCLHLELLREKLSPASVTAKKPEVLTVALQTEGSESTIPKLRKVSFVVTLLQRWRKKTLDNNEIDEPSSSLSDDVSISSSNSSEHQQYLRRGVKSRLLNQYQNLNEKTDWMEDSESNLGSLPCSLPDSSSVDKKSLNLETQVVYLKLHIYVLKGESPFYRLLHLTWKSCLLNDLACENENPKRHHLQTLWDSQKRFVFQMPDETDARLENLTSYLRRFPALKFYVWKEVGFMQHVIEHCRRHLNPPEVVTWQTQGKRHEVSIRGQQSIAQILSFLAECLRGYLVPKPYYEARNAFHVNLMESCIRATRLTHSRTNALSCAFEILHSWQEGQSLQLCYGNLFAKLSVDLQEHLAQILLEDISNGDWQYLVASRYEAAIRNGTLLLALLEHLDGYPFSILDGYQVKLRSMSLCELSSPLQPFWEVVKQGLLRFNVESK